MGREEGEGGRREDGGREKGSRFSEKRREAGPEPPSADQRFLCPRGNCLRADCQEWTLSEFQTEVRELVSTPKKPRR